MTQLRTTEDIIEQHKKMAKARALTDAISRARMEMLKLKDHRSARALKRLEDDRRSLQTTLRWDVITNDSFQTA